MQFITISLFTIGVSGLLLNRRNLIMMLICIEIMILSVNLQLITTSVLFDDVIGPIFCLSTLTIAAAESALGLALIMGYHRSFSFKR